ncbi:hypothetical protein [Paracoccus sp. (in: a-proteobacteria)]|uniref:hypothetical protein n=1 Tax=Paracoccus sp. TaxID=267 RepID=UPI0026DF6F1F|nr:hypothetical protein [Paracoccus sp. (in: a-proteobacteria)]
MGQTRDQRLRSPSAERCIHLQARAAWGTARQADQVGYHRRFIRKNNVFRVIGDGGQPVFEPICVLPP